MWAFRYCERMIEETTLEETRWAHRHCGQLLPARGPRVERLLSLEWKQRGCQGGTDTLFSTPFFQPKPTDTRNSAVIQSSVLQTADQTFNTCPFSLHFRFILARVPLLFVEIHWAVSRLKIDLGSSLCIVSGNRNSVRAPNTSVLSVHTSFY